MNTILIIVSIVLALALLYMYNKNTKVDNTNDELVSSLQSTEYKLQQANKNLETHKGEVERLNTVISQQENKLTQSLQKVAVKEQALHKELVFVVDKKSNTLAVNVKVKTKKDANGDTTLYPTIRRKVNGLWKEVPVYLKFKE